ncbi:S-adenosyl-L-methionine-dependent methyltransferase [Hypoxylon sp. EC38]|nr:S-adenosyl-L-methionine-dependent methyltransferase [Hypoxylon sp. EC38]
MDNAVKSSADFIDAVQSVLASKDETARKHMFKAAKQAMAMLETPFEAVWRLIMSPHAHSALMSLIKAGVIQEIAKTDSPSSADHLAKVTGADRLLLVRLLRPMNAIGVVKEINQEEYAPTAITKALGLNRALFGGYRVMFSATTRSFVNMPYYLEKTGFKNVEGPLGPFQDAHDTHDNMFSWIMKDPLMTADFNAFITGHAVNRKQWFESFDAEDILIRGTKTDPDATLMVDVGGGEGYDIAMFHKRYPDAPGRLILQDAVDSLEELTPKVERQKHDFFQPQPVKGARCYYFHNILHNWSDADCVKILKNTAGAMTPGYSKLLISEFVLPTSNTPLLPALLDIQMMAILNAMERTEAQYSKLLDAAGLKIAKVWSIGAETEGIVEAVLKT